MLVMEYLGSISGHGTVVQHGKDIAGATYDFEGYRTKHAGITCCGEVGSSPGVLTAIFGLTDIQLRTDTGSVLEIRFTGKTLKPSQDFAHVDVRGDIPSQKQEWRRRSGIMPTA